MTRNYWTPHINRNLLIIWNIRNQSRLRSLTKRNRLILVKSMETVYILFLSMPAIAWKTKRIIRKLDSQHLSMKIFRVSRWIQVERAITPKPILFSWDHLFMKGKKGGEIQRITIAFIRKYNRFFGNEAFNFCSYYSPMLMIIENSKNNKKTAYSIFSFPVHFEL